MMPIATAIVEHTRIQNQRLDHASRSERIVLSKAVTSLGSSDAIDRDFFFLEALKLIGFVYIVVSVLCIWEFTIGIKESIKNLFID